MGNTNNPIIYVLFLFAGAHNARDESSADLPIPAGFVEIATQAVAQITFYEYEDFEERSFTTDRPIRTQSR